MDEAFTASNEIGPIAVAGMRVFTADGSKLVLKPSQDDPCADRHSILHRDLEEGVGHGQG